LVFGTSPLASDGYDPDYDEFLPPPSPSARLDARFDLDLRRDFRATQVDTIVWDVHLRFPLGPPLFLSWNPAQFPAKGNLRLQDGIIGSLVNIDMRAQSRYQLERRIQHLQIIYARRSTFEKHVEAGWNLVALPYKVDAPFYLSVFPSAIPATMFVYKGQYVLEDTLELCTGYMLRFAAANTIPITGVEIDSCAIHLKKGWNLIGGVSRNVPLSEIVDPQKIITLGTLYGLNRNGYVPADTVKQGKGYWIHADSAGQISIVRELGFSATLAKRANDLPELSQLTTLRISDAKGAAQTLYLSKALEDSASKASFRLPPVPPAEVFDIRFSDDRRFSEGDNALIRIQASHYPLTIRVSNLPIDKDKQYVIQEIVGNEEIAAYPLREGEAIDIVDPKVNTLQLRKITGVPIVFALEQNYPNPFNPATEICYSISQHAKVSLVIYDILGRKVKTLVDKHQI
ncbi:MAG: T9SS type A sorting domain-containing protein, partial [bacterium]